MIMNNSNESKSFVIYDIVTTRIFCPSIYHKKTYASLSAAKAAMTRNKLSKDVYAIADYKDFTDYIEERVTRRHLLTGKEFTIPINTPACCDPSTETYHSM